MTTTLKRKNKINAPNSKFVYQLSEKNPILKSAMLN